jgi:cell wall-associated NlpC family hydrolase
MSVRHTRLRRALIRPAAALAALTVSTAGLLTVAAAPASAATATTMAIAPYRSQMASGHVQQWNVSLSAGSKRLPSKTVVFYTRPASTTTWTKYATKTTNSSGVTGVSFPVYRSTYVMAKFLGTSTYAASKSGGALVTLANPIGQKAVTEASRHQGKPYQWGAAGPSRFDCSGFTLYVWKQLGKTLPHNSGQQYNSVRHVAKSDKRIGDLIFIYTSSGIGHVGIYAGNGYMWHSPHSGDVVKKSQIYSSSYYVGRVA